LSQQALIIDVAAKMLADNLAALMAQGDFPNCADADAVPSYRAQAATALQPGLCRQLVAAGLAVFDLVCWRLRGHAQALRGGLTGQHPSLPTWPLPTTTHGTRETAPIKLLQGVTWLKFGALGVRSLSSTGLAPA